MHIIDLCLEEKHSLGRDAWNDFVSVQPGATYCHLFEWMTILERAYDSSCHYLAVCEESTIKGVLPLVHMRGLLSGNRLVSMPFLDRGGILAESERDVESLLDHALQIVRRLSASGLDLRGGFMSTSPPIDHRPRVTFELDLLDREGTWKAVGPKVRNQIRKSQKSGLVTHCEDVQGLPEFFQIFSLNMHRLGSPSHSLVFFRTILEEFRGKASIYVTRSSEGRAAAAALAIQFADCVTVPWASSIHSFRPQCPNHSLYWKIFEDAIDSDLRKFDFGRSSQGSGTFQFKKQWGGQQVPLRWTSIDAAGEFSNPKLMSSQSQPILARLWAALPPGIAKAMGPWIRKQLSN